MSSYREINLEQIYEVVRQIVDQFNPQSVILFGSYAYGEPGPESDVDLLVVMDTPLKEIDQAVEICRHIRCDFPIDLIVYKPDNFLKRIHMGDFMLIEISKKGKVLYERSHSRVD
ncbi:nucleotidyltransferase domain-containing protein [Thermoflexus hugenholtzii]